MCLLPGTTQCSDRVFLAQGLTIGGETAFSESTKQLFLSQNLYHVLVVSGFQIVIIALFLERFMYWLRLPIVPRFLFIIHLLVIYGFVTGFEAPVIRALTSITLQFVLLLGLGRRINELVLLTYTSIVCLIIFPHYIFSLSFQLSVTATIGVFASSMMTKQLPWFVQIPITTLCTFFTTLPLAAQFGNAISPVAVLSNLIVLPVIPLLSCLSLVSALPYVGYLFGIVTQTCIELVLNILRFLDSFSSYISIRFAAFTPLETVLYYILCGLLFFCVSNFWGRLTKTELKAKL